MKKIVIIPARLKSTRLSNKVLLDLKGKTVVRRVYEQCLKAKNIIMTGEKHQSGTDRIAEAIQSIDCDVVINVQGDEPFIEPSLIDELANSIGIDTQEDYEKTLELLK